MCTNNAFLITFRGMKGVTIIKDETHNKRFVQIDLDELENHQNELEDMLDIIISESRKDDEEVSWESLKNQLKEDGKL